MLVRLDLLDDPRFPSIATVGFATQFFPAYEYSEIALHDHDVVELFYIVAGEAEHHINGEVLPAPAGTLGVVHYGQSHCVTTPKGPVDIVNVYINPAAAPLPALEAPLSIAIPRILPLSPALGHNQNRVTQLQFPDPDRVTGILMAMNRESTERPPGWQDTMRVWMKLFLVECARHVLATEPPDPADLAPAAATLERLRRHLDEHFAEEVKLDELAKRSRISKAYLCRAFRRHTGRTVLEYVHQRRVEKAMVLLDSTEQRIAEIAEACGFKDLSHFNRIFRRVAGASPSDFRRREVAALQGA